MAGKIDKTRPEYTGIRSFVGTGVSTIPDIMEEQKDIRQMIQDMIDEALTNVVGATAIQDVPDQITYNFTGAGISLAALWNALNDLFVGMWDIYHELMEKINRRYRYTQQQIKDLQQQVNNLQSGTGSGVKIYKRISNHTDAGKYNTYLQSWVNGAWANVDTNTIVVKNVMETAGRTFAGTVYFQSVGLPDASDVVPVHPIHLNDRYSHRSNTGTTIVAHETVTKIPLAGDVKDPYEWYNSGNKNLVVPTTGMYFISADFAVNHGAFVDTPCWLRVWAGGGSVGLSSTRYTEPTGSVTYFSVNVPAYLIAGDTIHFDFYHQAGIGNTMSVINIGTTHAAAWRIK